MASPARLVARLTCHDWRDVAESFVTPLYQAEIDRWALELEWDAAKDWQVVERGRQLRTVPGLIVTDERGDVIGWTYFVAYDRLLQIGGFTSASETCTSLMLDAVLNTPEAAAAEAVTFFAFTSAPDIVGTLRRRGLVVSRYWYLSRAAARHPPQGPPRDARPWRMEDVGATAELLARAYGPSDGSRPFVPRGTQREWDAYVAQIVRARGCGELMPDASWCVPAGPGRLAAVALSSRIGPSTGHLVQLAVDPQFRGRGIGATLVEAACESSARAGCRRMTLLVEGLNRGARALYESLRFESAASFVAAGRLGAANALSQPPGPGGSLTPSGAGPVGARANRR